MNASDRFFAKVKPDPSGCLIWTGALDSNGYGRFQDIGGRNVPAHRWLLERVFGRNENLVADHLCRNPSCVRPTHLEFVTASINILRGVGPARNRERAASRTHCSREHPLSGENLYVFVDGRGKKQRRCLTCQRERVRTPETRRYHATYGRMRRLNERLSQGAGRVVVLQGTCGPTFSVEVFAGDTAERLAVDTSRALARYFAAVKVAI